MFYELEICELSDRSFSGKGEASRFYVELRFLEERNGSAFVLRGPICKTRTDAEKNMQTIPLKPTNREIVKKGGEGIPGIERSIPVPMPKDRDFVPLFPRTKKRSRKP